MNPLYYQPSGRFTISGLLAFLLAGLLAAVPLAFVYVYAVWYIPFIYLNFLFTLGLGFGLGLVLQMMTRTGHLRNPRVVGILGVVVGLWAWYVQWCVYITLLAGAGEVEEFGSRFSVAHTSFDFDVFLGFLLSPGEVLNILPALAEEGTWSLFKVAVSGVFLYLIWLIEFVVILIFSWLMPQTQAAEPYSEVAGQWAEKQTLPGPAAHLPDTTAAKAALEAADWEHLQPRPAHMAATAPFARLHIFRAPADPACCYLTLENVAIEVDDKGKTSENTTSVVEYLRLPSQVGTDLHTRFAAEPPVLQDAASYTGPLQ